MRPVKDGSKIFIKSKQTGKFLFFLRDDKPTIPNPNTWDLLGGGTEGNETPEETVRREVFEEVGLSLDKVELLKKREVMHTVGDKKYTINSYIFLAEIDIPKKELQTTEGQGLRWFTIKETEKVNISPTILPLINEFKNKI